MQLWENTGRKKRNRESVIHAPSSPFPVPMQTIWYETGRQYYFWLPHRSRYFVCGAAPRETE